jgi:hypothetical protein
MFHHVCLFIHKGWWKLKRLFGFALQGGRWEAPKSTHCRGHVWGPAEFYFLRDSAQKKLQRFPATYNSAITTPLLHNLSLHCYASNFSTNTHQSLLLYFIPSIALSHNILCILFTNVAQVVECKYMWINFGIWCKCFNIIISSRRK